MKLVPKFLTTTLILTLITSIITYGCKRTSNPCFVEVKIVNPSETQTFQSTEYIAQVVAKKKHVLELTMKV